MKTKRRKTSSPSRITKPLTFMPKVANDNYSPYKTKVKWVLLIALFCGLSFLLYVLS